ncbi:MAG: N-6 DNA methylase [Bacteroidales bacterium]|jgi:predicted helicase|nr:N-6 DNA methylase [Bacteroidales bacterium]
MYDKIIQYITELDKIYKAGNATEHTYRPALKQLLEEITTGLTVTNEPKRIACGAPDYIVSRGEIPVGYIETKDIGADLNGKANKEQFDRYRQSLDNLIITDYLTFQLFEEGKQIISVTIAKADKTNITADTTQFDVFAALIKHFTGHEGQWIQTSLHLSKVMAAKARLMANIIENALNSNEKGGDNSLDGQLKGFREVLIHDITHKEFADIYAQTIAYGMFAARLNDETTHTFTRAKAAQLIPHSNPFLRKLFQYIAGYDLDERICWVVEDLADLFNYVDINKIVKEFNETKHDPIVHFYETFLAEYDPALRKSRGVWYTPYPVVQFIVQAVDDILKQEFGLPQGLADASKVKRKKTVAQNGGNIKEEEKEYHRVQILDPATGTGTFLAEVVQNIHRHFQNQQGMWQSYAAKHLIPRINGFEILMASYAMAHLKLDMQLQKTGYKAEDNKRLRIYLTNSLEEAHSKTETLFAQWLSDEANEASHIKQDVPVMVVLGNPPYSGESQNSAKWMEPLMLAYKKEPSGIKLQEKNSKWINDDYVKFIRFGQHLVEENGEGILAYINNHSFLDNPTFRGMRWSLLKAFDTIYILDLHGNAKKKETTPDGSKDENVFDIQQGVSINIFVKTGHKKTDDPAKVFHYDLYGKRSEKYSFLLNNNLKIFKKHALTLTEPQYFFTRKDFSLQKEYEKGFSVQELFPVNSVGIVTARDNFTIHDTKQSVKNTVTEFLKLDTETARKKFNLGKDTREWSVVNAKKDLTSSPDFDKIVEINYRPFDIRYTYYTGSSKGFHCRSREKVMQHFLKGENVGLVLGRQGQVVGSMPWNLAFVTSQIIDLNIYYRGGGMFFPLYLYPQSGKLFADEKRQPNLKKEIVDKIARRIKLQFTKEKEETKTTFAPIDLLDYIYAALHSPSYRERYREFLKIDFPCVPYPQDAAQFWTLASLGAKLRRLHLMEGIETLPDMAIYTKEGEDEVEKPTFENNKVCINGAQYFDKVPTEAWNFYIGGYQPAQKWLKDRKGHKLEYDDIVHYQKIITVLIETGKVMREIDEVRENK